MRWFAGPILYWIKGTSKEIKQLIENRVSEVRKHIETDIWRHVLGILNPADIPMGEFNAKEFVQIKLWFKRPEFIGKPEEFWPVDISNDIRKPPPEVLLEEKSSVT